MNKKTIVPRSFFRTTYETSITLSAYTSKDTHAKHREEPELKIENGNAFQPVCPFEVAKDLNRERIERHLIWNKKKNPSSYISVFNHLCEFAYLVRSMQKLTIVAHAKRRAHFHYKDSQRIGHRVFITEIDTTGFVAATVSARCKTTVKIITKHRFGRYEIKSTEYDFDVDIPVWIRDPRKPEDRSDLTVSKLEELNTDMWISITEIRASNLNDGPKSRNKYNRDCICSKGHSYEWLACGTIPKSRIIRVMPFDGKVLYEHRTTQIIRSRDSTEPWVWSWDKLMWVLDSALTAIAEWRDMEAHQAREARKRRLEGAEGEEVQERPFKRIKPIELTIIRPYIKSLALRTGTARAC
jgi:hypothetical protein